VSRPKLRSQREVVDRCAALAQEVSAAEQTVAARRTDADEPALVSAVWRGEALGTLLWGLGSIALPPYDTPFATADVLAVPTAGGHLRDGAEVAHELAVARLWHWRARTAALHGARATALPDGYSSFEQLIGATAMRGYERGLIAQPLRGDFRALGTAYRQLSQARLAELHSIAHERHHALAWLTGTGSEWAEVLLET